MTGTSCPATPEVPVLQLRVILLMQDDAVRRISGTFRTTPTLPLHHMLAIPPIKYMVIKLRQQVQLRLTRLPPNHKLRTIVSSDQTRLHPDFISVPTPLTSLLPSVFPPFYRPLNHTWSHPQLSSSLTRPRSNALSAAIIQRASDSTDTSTSVFLYPLPHPDHYVTAFIIAQDDNIVAKGFSADTNKLRSNAEAASLAAQQLAALPQRNTTFFLPSPLLHSALLSLHKHNNLPSAFSFTTTLSGLLLRTPDIYFSLLHLPCKLPKPPKPGVRVPEPHIFSHNWPGPPCKNHILEELRSTAQSHTLAPPPTPPKLLAFQRWQADNPEPIPCKWTRNKALPIPDTPEPPPFMQGALSLKQQGASSLALQVLLKHCFSGDYSARLRPGAGDNTTCPCSFGPPYPTGPGFPRSTSATMPGLTTHPITNDLPNTPMVPTWVDDPTTDGLPVPSDQAGYDRLMAEFLSTNRSPTPLVHRPHARPRHPTTHSAHHAIFSCPITASLRHQILGHNPSPDFLFHTDKGAVALLTFLLRSNSLRRPLPPRPDPP